MELTTKSPVYYIVNPVPHESDNCCDFMLLFELGTLKSC